VVKIGGERQKEKEEGRERWGDRGGEQREM
jgi:hypothetical protein